MQVDAAIPVNARNLVDRFYGELWNQVDLEVADELLHPDVEFRGSVGQGAVGVNGVRDYVTMVTTALLGYRCTLIDMIDNGNRAAARVRFSGTHVGSFLGYPPTGRVVEWMGAAFFTAEGGRLRDIWVLGDLVSLREQLSGG